ncbi:phage late control D family protein [Variovorax sp. GB1P17]|uniref:phage late control D family protein n=1 Tax=Variovorax sp. GB1P17 TaxID=3443740 RepID=UPI003F44C2AD
MTGDPVSSATAPRVAAFANNERLEGVIGFEVDANSFYQADTFRLTLCLSAQPANRDWNWWSMQTSIEVELLAGYPDDVVNFTKTDLVSLVVGNVDDIEIDPIRDEIVMGGRDLTSAFIDNKIIDKFQNLTASQVATKLAKEHGLTPVVTATQGTVGSYYQIDHVSMQDDKPEWDVLTYLAQVTGNVVYVKGRELHFEPKTDPATQNPYVLKWQRPTDSQFSPVFNAMTLSVSRNLTIAKDVRVTVRSWNQKQKKGFTVTADRKKVKNQTTSKVARSTGPPQQYSFFFPNMTPDEAQKKANQLLKDISEHEVNLNAEIPGDPAVTPSVVIRLQGTETAFDQLFYPASVLHTYDESQGYRTSIRAKNSSPESTVQP